MCLSPLLMVQFLWHILMYQNASMTVKLLEGGNIYAKLEAMFGKNVVQCAVDSGFGKTERDFMVNSTQDDLSSSKTTCQEAKLDVKIKRATTSMRQLAEWCVRGFQASFPRMKDHFDYEDHGERRIIMKLYVMLFNLRLWLVGINQICNVYMPW